MKYLIIANWKCNPSSLKKAEELFCEIKQEFKKTKNIELVICPPFVFLSPLTKKIGKTKIALGSQNVFYKEGPFTGEVSPKMLNSLGIKYVIVGHSERRKLGEDNLFINKKIKSLLELKMKPILCVGETKEEREKGKAFEIVKKQLLEGLKNIKKSLLVNLIVAYEPVWAISTNKGFLCGPDDIMTMRLFIEKILTKNFGPKISKRIKILYGGSVDDKNASLVKSANVDGVLVGSASLSPPKFTLILQTFS